MHRIAHWVADRLQDLAALPPFASSLTRPTPPPHPLPIASLRPRAIPVIVRHGAWHGPCLSLHVLSALTVCRYSLKQAV